MQGLLTIPRVDTINGRDPDLVDHSGGNLDEIALPLPRVAKHVGPPRLLDQIIFLFAQETLW